MRFKRLREKIEKELGSGPVSSANVNSSPQQPDTGNAKKAKKSSQKRKAPDDDDVKDPILTAGFSQVDGQIDTPTPKRQTRGVQLNFDVKACYSSDEDSSSLSSFEESDSEYISAGKTAKIQGEILSAFEDETDIEPKAKRVKKSRTLTPAYQATPVQAPSGTQPGGNQNKPTDTGRSTISKPNINTVPRTATTAKKQASSKNPVAKKVKAKPGMHFSQTPLPSVESSPPPDRSNAVADVKSGESVSSEESEIDIRSFKPGTILTFPSQRQQKQSEEAQLKHENVSSAVAITSSPSSPNGFAPSIASSESSSHGSAGKMLKDNLAAVARLTEVQPGESASNPGSGTAEDTLVPPPTPAGK